MEIRVLGPVELWHSGRQVPLVRRQQRTILGILGLRVGARTTGDQLINLIWSDDPPPRARAIIQSRISELRSILGDLHDGEALRISGHAGMYELQITPDMVDAHRFCHLIDQARAASDERSVRQHLRTALSLWRGEMFAGHLSQVAYATLCQGLESARLTAAENLFDLELRRGNHDRVADEVHEYATANPSRERLVAQMMLALHRAGRTAEALRSYDQWRRGLRDELGIDPTGEVQELHRAILKDDPALRPTLHPTTAKRGEADAATFGETREDLAGEADTFHISVPCLLPPDIREFAGRDSEVKALLEVLGAASGPSTPLVAVSGPAGVGKSALSIHIAYQLRDTYPDGQLYVNLHGVDDDRPADPFDVLGRFLRSLGVDGSSVPKTIDERLELYRALLSTRRVLVLLDNAASDEQVDLLVPNGQRCAVIINSRQRLGVSIGAHAINLDVLPDTVAIGLLSRIAGAKRISDESSASVELCAYCGYLPLAVRIAAARLAAKPHWRVAKLADMLRDERDRLNQLALGWLDVRASISLSYRGLDGETQRLLRLLGHVALPDITVLTCAALIDDAASAAETLLEQLFDAQLLHSIGFDAADYPRYRMHDLVRLFAHERAEQEDSPQELYAARDRVYGAFLAVADAARQTIFGGCYQDIPGNTPRWSKDNSLVRRLATDPQVWFEADRSCIAALVNLAAKHDSADPCWELASANSPLFQMRRCFAEWQSVLNIALAATRVAGNRRGEAVVLYRKGLVAADYTDIEAAGDYFRKARDLFDELGDAHGHATAGTYVGMVERFQGNIDVALSQYEEAIPLLQAAHDIGGIAFARRAIAQILTGQDKFDLAEQQFDESLRLYRAHGGLPGEAQVLYWRSRLRLRQGRREEAQEGFGAALRIAQRIGDRPGEAVCLHGLATCYRSEGHVAEARRLLLKALRLVKQPTVTLSEVRIRQALSEL